MKHLIIIRLSIISFIGLFLFACDSFDETRDVKKVEPISVHLKMNIQQEGLTDFDKVTVELQNYEEGLKIKLPYTSSQMKIDSLIPGVYDIKISGVAISADDEQFTLGGGDNKVAVLEDNIQLEYDVQSLILSPLIFKEIYYCGSRQPNEKQTVWFRDQYYEIYNNGVKTIYLDGLYFASLDPWGATANTKIPNWPAEDKGKYVYSQWVWKIPGKGKDYPLAPGESVVLAQLAVDQRIPAYNPQVPIDCSIAEFEFKVNNPTYYPEKGNAPSMELVFYNGTNSPGKSLQYMTGVAGIVYAIFQIPEGEVYDPVNDKSMKTQDGLGGNPWYAKILIDNVLDAVEAGPNETSIQYKRAPILLDKGMTTVGNMYIAKSIARKVAEYNEDGTPRLQDTNDSTEDFDTGLVPEIRRYGAKMPSWNPTLNKGK